MGLIHHRAAEESRLLTEQLQYALNSRVIIEQAKGVLAQHSRLDMHDAFAELRRYARNHNTRLVDVARAVADRTLPAQTIIAGQSTRRR
jgi:AmiR/NasT family two-component response regulator